MQLTSIGLRIVCTRSSPRTLIQATLNQRFPDFRYTLKACTTIPSETQALLAEDEALIVLDFDQHSYGEVITRSSVDEGELSITAKNLEARDKDLACLSEQPVI